jgi:hypothetical protein
MGVFEEVERDAAAVGRGITSLFHRDQPAPAPVPSFTPRASRQSQQSQPKGSPVSNAFAEIGHLLAVADEETVHALNVVLAHPEGIAVVSKLASLAGVNVPPGTITAAVAGLDAVLSVLYPPQQAAPAQQAADGTGAQQAQDARVTI